MSDTLARLSIYTLPEPSPSFAPLLQPLLTSRTIPDTLLLILLDWSEPWNWVRQIHEWIQLLREVLSSLDEDTKSTMEEIMQEWQQRRRGVAAYDSGTGASSGSDLNVIIPLGPGEWDEALGLPLCAVCHNVSYPRMNAMFVLTSSSQIRWTPWREIEAGGKRSLTTFYSSYELSCSNVRYH